jgi:RimJ/RimL family protein N-acetyltransferase
VFAVLANEPDIPRWTRIPWPYTRAHLDQFFSLMATWHRTRSDAVFAITPPGEGAVIGSLGVHRIAGTWRPRSGFLPDEPGYWLAPSARGRGVMSDALGLACRWLLDELQRPQVNIQTKSGNAASRAVIERVGFRFTGTVKATEIDDDPNPADHDRFVLRRGDLRTGR